MAIASKKQPRAKSNPQPKRAAKAKKSGKPATAKGEAAKSTVPSLDDIEEPDRSSPALAEVDADALEFIAAIDRFKKENGRPFPSWSEVLLVLRQLGYRRR